MAPNPPHVRSAPAEPWRFSGVLNAGPRDGPQPPTRSQRPGGAVALLWSAQRRAPRWPPTPNTFAAPRRSRGASRRLRGVPRCGSRAGRDAILAGDADARRARAAWPQSESARDPGARRLWTGVPDRRRPTGAGGGAATWGTGRVPAVERR